MLQAIPTMAEQVDASILPERLVAMLSSLFGVVAALLLAIGLYGLLAYTVTRRLGGMNAGHHSSSDMSRF